MARQYAQSCACVYGLTGAMTVAGASSGSLVSLGYAELFGMYRSDVVMAGCGVQVAQSIDGGTNYDITTTYAFGGASTAASSVTPIVGDRVKITLNASAVAPSTIRAKFWLRPLT